MSNILLSLTMIPLISGPLLLLLPKKALKLGMLIVQAVMVLGSIYLFAQTKIFGPVVNNLGDWSYGIGIVLYADLIGAAFVLVIVVVFFICMLYQLSEYVSSPRFYSLLMILEALTIGIFLSQDLFNIFVMVEVATVVVSLLIMYNKDSVAIYDGILYLLVNTVAMSFFLLGVGMLYKTLGVINLSALSTVLQQLPSGKSVIVPYCFIITALCLKSAVMPLFSWLPRAHATPSAPVAVSAILSGIYVKSAIYIFMRVQSVFSPVIKTDSLFLLLGFVTAVIGFLLAICQNDIKLILAYHTISQIGMIMMGLSMGNEAAKIGAVYHIINHALFKSALFLTAGIISDSYKTRDLYKIKGVFRNLPLVSIAAFAAILGITGAPFFNGSISKYWLAYAAKESWLQYGLILVNLGTIISFVKYSQMFWGRQQVKKAQVRVSKQIAVTAISLLCLLGGIFGGPIIRFAFEFRLQMDGVEYLLKAITFLVSLAVAVGVYYFVIKKVNLQRYSKMLNMGFNGICTSMGVFIVILLIYVSVVTY